MAANERAQSKKKTLPQTSSECQAVNGQKWPARSISGQQQPEVVRCSGQQWPAVARGVAMERHKQGHSGKVAFGAATYRAGDEAKIHEELALVGC
jgi:hypothetical protein